jgi:hypothetical protein
MTPAPMTSARTLCDSASRHRRDVSRCGHGRRGQWDRADDYRHVKHQANRSVIAAAEVIGSVVLSDAGNDGLDTPRRRGRSPAAGVDAGNAVRAPLHSALSRPVRHRAVSVSAGNA